MAADIAQSHHECWDGTGYPFGVAGEAIPLPGRIVALADAFDAMTHDRPYRAALALPDVMAEIERCSGTHFDPALVNAFHQLNHRALLESPSAKAGAACTPFSLAALEKLSESSSHGLMAAVDTALDAAFDNTPVAALIADDDRRYVAANTAACKLLGLTIEELRQKRIDDLVPHEARPHLDNAWDDFLRGGVRRGERTLLLPDNRTIRVAARGVAHLLPGRHLALFEPLTANQHKTKSDASS